MLKLEKGIYAWNCASLEKVGKVRTQRVQFYVRQQLTQAQQQEMLGEGGLSQTVPVRRACHGQRDLTRAYTSKTAAAHLLILDTIPA